ncbi:major histocompatibility complex class I-related gene protein-like isoform X4 [Epinephelus fuscoguttatus]|uniref:major histocompatibility complex class I-related gene protein-like isoform X4 n=1 Tax=Epinephelus fuscoguttatus TaxID=293821 RepID=UPI0020CFEE11|nr:major histocompatibility complex class I-related gene protein-like isoform X4 [Epinephelus fuscoguttatus]
MRNKQLPLLHQNKMKNLLLLLLLCHVSSSVKHSLKFFVTASSGVPNFPQLVGTTMVDDILAGYCDTDTKILQPKQDWMKTAFENNPQHLEWYTQYCFEILPHTYKAWMDDLKQHFNQSGDLPSVSLLQKSPSSPVSCHATGFYPDRAMMFWRKDGEEIHEDVELGEILPNHDGSFQKSVDLNLSSVPPEDWRRYDCVFHLSGVKDHIVTTLDKAVIRTNMEKPSDITVPITAAVVVLVLVVSTGFIVYKKRKAKLPPSPPDGSSELSEKTQSRNLTD